MSAKLSPPLCPYHLSPLFVTLEASLHYANRSMRFLRNDKVSTEKNIQTICVYQIISSNLSFPIATSVCRLCLSRWKRLFTTIIGVGDSCGMTKLVRKKYRNYLCLPIFLPVLPFQFVTSRASLHYANRSVGFLWNDKKGNEFVFLPIND